MSIDPNQIQLTPEQREQIALVAQSQNRSWQEVLEEAVANVTALSRQDLLAIAASVRDLEGGVSGRPFDEFAREFRRRNRFLIDACGVSSEYYHAPNATRRVSLNGYGRDQWREPVAGGPLLKLLRPRWPRILRHFPELLKAIFWEEISGRNFSRRRVDARIG